VKILKSLQVLHGSCNPTCITTRCRKHRCVLLLPRQGTLCVECDGCGAFPTQGTKPDFILLYAETNSSPACWFVVEMKGRVHHPRAIVRQLQTGADAIQNDHHFKVPQSPTILVPIVLHEGHIHAADFDILKSVSYLGKSCFIRTKRCGIAIDSLVSALE